MTEVHPDPDMATPLRGVDFMRGGFAAATAAGHEDAHAQQQLEEMEVVKSLLAQRILEINTDGALEPDEKAKLVANLHSAATTGSLSALKKAISDSIVRARAEVAENTANREEQFSAMDAVLRARESAQQFIHGFNEYSAEGKDFIVKSIMRFNETAFGQQLNEEYKNLNPEQRAQAEAEIKQSWQTLGELKAQHADKNDPYNGLLKYVEGCALPNTPDGKELLEAIKNGEDPNGSHIQGLKDKALHFKADHAKPVIDAMMDKIDPAAREYLQSHYTADEKGTAHWKMATEWGGITLKERNAAFVAYHNNGGDISKLDPEQQRIVSLAQVMVPADNALAMQGAMAIIQRDHGIETMLGDKSQSQEQRAEALKIELNKQGYSSAMLGKASEDIVQMLDADPKLMARMKAGDTTVVTELLSSRLADKETTSTTPSYSAQDVTGRYLLGTQQWDKDTQEWLKGKDTNGDGKIDLSEIRNAMQAAGVTQTQVDADKNGSVSKEELLALAPTSVPRVANAAKDSPVLS